MLLSSYGGEPGSKPSVSHDAKSTDLIKMNFNNASYVATKWGKTNSGRAILDDATE